MLYEDVESKKYEVYSNVVFKNKKKKLPVKKKEKKEVKPNPTTWILNIYLILIHKSSIVNVKSLSINLL